jgi:hypothetical protein
MGAFHRRCMVSNKILRLRAHLARSLSIRMIARNTAHRWQARRWANSSPGLVS